MDSIGRLSLLLKGPRGSPRRQVVGRGQVFLEEDPATAHTSPAVAARHREWEARADLPARSRALRRRRTGVPHAGRGVFRCQRYLADPREGLVPRRYAGPFPDGTELVEGDQLQAFHFPPRQIDRLFKSRLARMRPEAGCRKSSQAANPSDSSCDTHCSGCRCRVRNICRAREAPGAPASTSGESLHDS